MSIHSGSIFWILDQCSPGYSLRTDVGQQGYTFYHGIILVIGHVTIRPAVGGFL